ncbi:MAG TPA: Mpo1-like protein [Rhizomicrobium sp.]|nr:Mpo1-like protein [Rhizomicrobium sp.]
MQRYASFADFYPFYLSEHANRTTRRLHFLGSSLALFCLLELFFTGDVWWLAAGLVTGYGFAWFSHLVFEKNRPATFRQPVFSFMGDWVMYWQILTGRIPF